MKKETAVSIKNMFFSYEKTSLFNDFSLDIYKKEYTCILGHNGSGKSTLAKIITGLFFAKKGKVFVFGKEIKKDSVANIREDVGIVFQNPDSQFVGTTVEYDIAFGLENHKFNREEMKEIILSVLDKVKMSKFITHCPSKLSGGQKQKIAIAGILAISPQLIIFDEATSMLDAESKNEMLDLINELNKKHGITIISITHDMEKVINSNRVIVLENGKIVADKKTKDIIFDKSLMEKYKLNIPMIAKFVLMLEEKKIISKRSLDLNEVISWL